MHAYEFYVQFLHTNISHTKNLDSHWQTALLFCCITYKGFECVNTAYLYNSEILHEQSSEQITSHAELQGHTMRSF